jgi:bifunctional UDP-N-acetylglucosamine pyrophosphorylase/glucosamine-1-phosphate N-acetyltransferase
MGSGRPKACVETQDRLSLVEHVLTSASALRADPTIVVTGHQRELVEERVLHGASLGHYSKATIRFAHQPEQLGTGHAVKCALPLLSGFKGTVVIVYGDVPLLMGQTFTALVDYHRRHRSILTLVTACSATPGSLGRVVRSPDGASVARVVEVKDCAPEELLIDEINAGLYAVDSSFLAPAIESLKNQNAQKEYYLTDIVARANQDKHKVLPFLHSDFNELQGVNTLYELASVNRSLRERRIKELILSGVTIVDPASVIIDRDVSVSPTAVIGPNVQLLGKTSVAAEVVIEGSAYLRDCDVRRSAVVKFGVRAEGAVIGENSSVGPFANLRSGTALGRGVRVGNFVETKNATLGDDAKASHLAYLGDCSVGDQSNIGAGTITCNYDGFKKEHTEIGKRAFIGSNSTLIAPVTIADGAYVGAASVISEDVPADSLVLTRAPRVEKEGWAKRRRERVNPTKKE